MIVHGFCQLTNSSQQSPLHQLYRLTNDEARYIFQKNPLDNKRYRNQLLHTPAAAFTPDQGFPDSLSSGHYLEVYAQQSRVKYIYHAIENVRCKFINNGTDLAVVVHDLQGRIITNATVRFRGQPVAFDAASQTYLLRHSSRVGLLEVEHDKVINLFDVKQETSFRRRPFRFRQLFAHRHRRNYNYHYQPAKQRYTGYLVFNKPKFKPQDTVRLKAFIRDRKGRPVNTPVWLRLRENYNSPDIDTIIARLSPYRPGAFEYSFVLDDSLDLDLDTDYQLTLEGGRNKPLRYDEEEDDENQRRASKRKVMISEKFAYEEYELGSVTFTARADHSSHTRGTPVAVYFKATDENNLPVMDGRVRINIERQYINRAYQPILFVPDTLWQYELPLEPAGETKLMLPDSIFPAASIDYRINCLFLSASNESQPQTLYQHYLYPQEEISFSEQADSLEIRSLFAGKSVPDKGQLVLLSTEEDTLQQVAVDLPVKIPLHPFAASYVITTAKTSGDHTATSADIITGMARRTRDSVFIQVFNSHHVPFWYTIHAGKKVVEQGYLRDNLDRNFRATTLNAYTISWQYIRNDKVASNRLAAVYAEKALQVNIAAPLTIFPGQTARLSLSVKDADGNPVSGADVTSYAATSKFSNLSLPFVPYYGKPRVGRLPNMQYKNDKRDISDASDTYNREYWGRRLSLDTSVYYQFLHPKGISSITEPVAGNETQLAPFISINGAPQQIVYLWIDGQPAYLDDANIKPAYSFPLTPGYHQLRIRTAVKLITADSVYVTAGRKTFLNINIADNPPHVKVQSAARLFSKTERESLRPYFVRFFQPGSLPAYSYIQQDKRLLPIFRSLTTFTTWPLEPRPATLAARNWFSHAFTPASGGVLSVGNGTDKFNAAAPENFNRIHADNRYYEFPLYETALTPSIIDSMWQAHRENTRMTNSLYNPKNSLPTENARLQLVPDSSFTRETVKQFFLYRYQDPSFYRIHPSGAFNFDRLNSGWYRLLILQGKNSYRLVDSIYLRANGTTVYQLTNRIPVLPADQVSRDLAAEIWNQVTDESGKRYYTDENAFSSAFNTRYLEQSSLRKTIEGVVTNEDGQPLPGAMVRLKHTNFGVTADINGHFKMNVTDYGTLSVSTIGYNPQEVNLSKESFFLIKLTESQLALQEVVVTAFSIQERRALTGSVSGIRIKGIGTLSGNNAPLIIIDGKIYEGDLDAINPDSIGSMSVMKDEAARAIYGARAANGVILIQTSAGKNNAPAGNNLRQRFRDDAFWQPRLRTNEKGEASFDVTFPDDITNWKTFAIAMTDRKQSGAATTSIKAFQPLATNLALPAFVVAGDTLQALGKILNYTADSVILERRFYAYDQLLLQGTTGVKNSHLDTVMVVVPQQRDSLPLKFTIHRDDFMDGERRAIPIFAQGVTETTGIFLPLRKDTAFTVPVTDTGAIKVYATSSLLPVLQQEITRLKRYEYDCNEQMASKLIAVLQEKQLCAYEQRTFREEELLRQLLRVLADNQYLGGWGWWGKSEPAYWITKHVTAALLMAEKAGYTLPVKKQALLDYHQLLLASRAPGSDKLTIVETLQQLGAKMDYRGCLDTLAVATAYDKARKMYILQRAGEAVNTANLLQSSQRSMMGNPYWGEESQDLQNNNVQFTLLVYKLLRQQSGHEDILAGIREWLMERRHSGSWRNTYESASILETILPDMLQNGQPLTASLTLNGRAVGLFPFDTVIRPAQPLQVSKRGNATVYFTATQEHWSPAPEAVSKQFTVQSSLVSNEKPLLQLIAGTAVELRVDVTVNADADYVMIEVPIPAGCSYAGKAQSHSHGEVHREHFKQKVSIFSHHLTKGRHTFTVSLMPRYSGSYQLNPAKASMMYFPTFFGRTGMKHIIITGK